MDVAFLGLGTMGTPMARNVVRRGHRLTVWNRTRERAEPLREEGADVAETPAAAAAQAECVLLMLSDPAAVSAVLDGPHGVTAGLRPDAVVVDMSTVDPATARAADLAVRAAGGRFVDAPVSGTRQPAIDARLLVLAGGADTDVERVRPVLETMGRVLRVGEVGQGMAMKLVLNGLGAHMMTAFAAVLVLGTRLGLSPRAMLDVISAGAFGAPMYAAKGERILAGDFSPDFALRLLHKDQELVLGTAASLDYPMPTLTAVRDVIGQAVDAGFGELDLSAVVRLFESWADVQVRTD